MPTESNATKGNEEHIHKMVVVAETCPEMSPCTQDNGLACTSTTISKSLSYDGMPCTEVKSIQNEIIAECQSPPAVKKKITTPTSAPTLSTPDRDFIHMLVKESYTIIDNSNHNTVKQLIEKVKKKEAHLVKEHGKELSAARDEVATLRKDKEILIAQLEESRKTIREAKSSVSLQINLHKTKHKLELQKMELELTKLKKDKSDAVAKRNSTSVTHDLKHERLEHKRTKEHLGLVISNKDGTIKDLKGSIKLLNDKIASHESEIKSLNKELRAFGKSFAQEEQKINGRLKLQGNKRRSEEKVIRMKLKKKGRTSRNDE